MTVGKSITSGELGNRILLVRSETAVPPPVLLNKWRRMLPPVVMIAIDEPGAPGLSVFGVNARSVIGDEIFWGQAAGLCGAQAGARIAALRPPLLIVGSRPGQA